MSMLSTLTLMNESFLQDQTLGFQIIHILIHIMIHIFSLVELIKEVDDGGSSSFGILVTFYLSIWKVFSSFWILFKGIQKKIQKNIKIIKKQASMERLRVLYMGRETIPDIREAVFTNREKRSSPLITLNNIRIIQEEVHF